jgi:rhomboid protease GluP
MNQSPASNQYPEPPPQQPVKVAVPTVRPYVTYTLLGLTIFVYLLQLAGQYLFKLDLVTALGLKVNDLIRQGQIWRLITPVFLHDDSLPYGLLHIGFNMYALYAIGRSLEARFGHSRFLLLYFLGAYAGNVLSFLLTSGNSLGASTAIFGLFAAEAAFVFQNRKLFQDKGRAALGNVISLAAINLFLGFTIPNVDNFGHIGGMLGGLIFTWFGGPRWKVECIYPSLQVVDEREGHGSIIGAAIVLLIFIPLAVIGWIWPK